MVLDKSTCFKCGSGHIVAYAPVIKDGNVTLQPACLNCFENHAKEMYLDRLARDGAQDKYDRMILDDESRNSST